MDHLDKQKLKEILEKNEDVVDNTYLIRDEKYSDYIKHDVEKLIIFKETHKELYINNREEYNNMLTKECHFLHTNYSEIFDKLNNGTLDHSIMFKFIEIYKEIEDGTLDQHEASFKIGKMLKEMYVDTALSAITPPTQTKNISYSEWVLKQQHIKNTLKNV
jgi:hypothetical protein